MPHSDASSAKNRTAAEVLDGDFPVARAKLLELAAILDRVARAEDAAGDGRLAQIRDAIALLHDTAAGPANATRAERLQLLFSDDYDDQWRRRFGV